MKFCSIVNIEKNSKKLESLYSGSPIYLMRNVYQVTSQCGLNTSNGLCGKVVATCEPLIGWQDIIHRHSPSNGLC